jgi:hypothetical protein
MDFKFPKVNSSFVLPKTAVMAKADIHFIILFCILIVGLAVADFCRIRAEARAAAKAAAKVKEAKEVSDREDLMKRIESVEVTHNTFMTNYKDLILHLATLHKARLVRDDMRRKYNDNTRRSAELITANHNAIMAYKKEKDTLSAYLIQYT